MVVPSGQLNGVAASSRGTDIKTEGTPSPAYLGHQFDEILDTKGTPFNTQQSITVFSFHSGNDLTVKAACFTNIFSSTIFE